MLSVAHHHLGGGLDAGGPGAGGGVPKLIWVSVVLTALLWWVCWGIASAMVRWNSRTAAVLLRAVDARTRRMRVRNLLLAAPLLATVFNLLLVAVLAHPMAALDSGGEFGLGLFLMSRREMAIHSEYIGFCAVAACVSMAAVFVHSSLITDLGPGQVDASLAIAAATWGACGVLAAASVLAFSGLPPRAVFMASAVVFVVAALSGGTAAASGRIAAAAANAKKLRPLAAPMPRSVSYALVATGAALLAGKRLLLAGYPSARWIAWLSAALLLAGAASLAIDIGSDRALAIYLSKDIAAGAGAGAGDDVGAQEPPGTLAPLSVTIVALALLALALFTIAVPQKPMKLKK